jgi:hypothetical protein
MQDLLNQSSFSIRKDLNEDIKLGQVFNSSFNEGFQDKGVTHWYCEIGIGTLSQTLKMCSDMPKISSLCAENSCMHCSDAQFADIFLAKEYSCF